MIGRIGLHPKTISLNLTMKACLYWPLLCAFLLLGSLVSKAEEPLVNRHLYVEVTAPPEIQNLLKSTILRRLRQFNDVEIEPDEQSAEVILLFQAVPIELPNGTRSGYAISLVNTSRLQIGLVEASADALAATQPNNPISKSIKDEIKGATVYQGSLLYICPSNGVESVARTIVTDIDTHVLEPVRQMLRRTLNQHKAEHQ